MTARIYTPEEEALYKLRPLPDIPFIGAEESQRRRAIYESGQRTYRVKNPDAVNIEPGDEGYVAPKEGESKDPRLAPRV